ncbi:MAG: hypothetical protein WBG90_08770 [Saonia sp.]
MDFIKEWGLIAGVAGLGLGVFLILFREVIRKKIFPTLTKKQGFQIILIFMILVWSLALFSLIIYFNQSQNSNIKTESTDRELVKDTWNHKKSIFQELIVLTGKISANSNNDSILKELKPKFNEFYEGSMIYAEANDRELLKRMMILRKDYENEIQKREDYYKPEKLKQSCQKLIKQLNSTISQGDLIN